MKRWIVLVVILIIIVLILYLRWNMIYNKILTFIQRFNNPLSSQIAKAVMKYKGFFPAEFVTAHLHGESGFNPNAIGQIDAGDMGIGQISESAIEEIERYYGIKVDRSRVFEIDYNIYLTCLFLKRCKQVARPYAKQRGVYLYYATLLTYKDWLTWTEWTYTKADRTWEVYNELRYGYQRYGRFVGDVRYARAE